mgnify:CR=1 FL=1
MTRNKRINRALCAFAREVGCHPTDITVLEPIPGHYAFWYRERPSDNVEAVSPKPKRPILSHSVDVYAMEVETC